MRGWVHYPTAPPVVTRGKVKTQATTSHPEK